MERVVTLRHARLTIAAFLALSTMCTACSLVMGHFHQVTAIRGRIVGKDLGLLGFRWFRQTFRVNDATLTLYEYRSPAKVEELKRVAAIKTDSYGDFDFGDIPKGHYSLDINVTGSDRLGGWFDVEITDSVKTTKNITIDVSPITPECTGGHADVRATL